MQRYEEKCGGNASEGLEDKKGRVEQEKGEQEGMRKRGEAILSDLICGVDDTDGPVNNSESHNIRCRTWVRIFHSWCTI